MMHYRIAPAMTGMKQSDLSRLARETLAGLLAEAYGISPLPEIAADCNGKPFFPEHGEIHFSLSHCSRAVLAVVSCAPVGCDIEDIQQDIPDGLLDITLSEEERRAFDRAERKEETFTLIWTRKEAAVKRTGFIPDNPGDWPSDAPGLVSRLSASGGYAFSIAT